MNGVQIEHILNLIEDKSAYNREGIRREVAAYLTTNMTVVVDSLADKGEAIIPTTYGGLKLTKADLDLVAA
jgi:hypothetical protein